MSKINHLGATYGRWTVLRQVTFARNPKYLCRCECGREKEVQISNVRSGKSRSCGCLQKEWMRANITKHRMIDHPAYRSWHSLRNRCRNPKNQDFAHYGGRGITVCERWDDFRLFWEDMGPTWFVGGTIERKDVNGNYEPGNCTWITQAAQTRNRRICIILDTPWGRITAAEAARKVGISESVFLARLRRDWPAEQLFSSKRFTRWNRAA